MLTKKEVSALYALRLVAQEAVEYVGFANYAERERHAKKEISRNFNLFMEMRYSEIGFKEDGNE